MPTPDPYKERDLERLQIFVYLIPVIGFLPALWTLYRQQGSLEQRNASRLVVSLTTAWVLGYLLLGAGAQLAEGTSMASTVSLLILSSLLTSGYFLVNLWLMVRLWQRKSLRLPGMSQLGDRLP
ncbi:MAG: hypothetical protein EDM05_043575 [Leptolyngbya sp. IPPAS B-1204]|nr:hypothetical protein [Elainella sp. C42_A2020_010]RNJ70056.1 MAG: hypothetical protein EDM05_04995 [Leptolyngbya sp. IPPAS B-1204]